MTPDDRIYAYSAVLMGSPILLKLFEHNESLASRVFRLIKQQENIFTVNRPHSEVMAVNHAAGSHPVEVSQPVYELIKRAKAVSLLNDSLFNFTIGPLVKRWKIGFNGHSVPAASDLQSLLALTNPRDVVLDDAARSVFLQHAGMEIDLGAIAKGYIADVVRDFLLAEQVPQGLINLGGNVQTLGASGQEGWGIGLKKPFAAEDALLGVIHVSNKSVVTSGIYERYFELDGRRYHHILDPKTGYPLDNELQSVTVISEDSIDGDIYTTLLYGMGIEKSLEYLQDLAHIEAIFVTKQQQIVCSSQRQFGFTLLDNSYQLLR
ncbi:MAG: FAD:protein FMN transferase [Ewingella americana]|jgi:thiamine biosynthesis lipoprotein|uniref:FAD:protein FMN transferase n=1 Tax=Ewingella americana TaxID=41202 RepID=UPI00242F34B5|nr:FAD:protein FMN transferase [Ewingella americana]MCI1679368.1 FAD:protein FMN transferase [Ewingella americana]MCI1854695.1 FAD:protein FMN transferase [Ewingella americana]MCI1862022.1 FAD:protein FMN transferase [Ewingella americana]MCI2142597.1 FAD:protein FMN transferase [Ewingella americana]MCI2162229.1 FAD:protein FMN transferase [Ewingella americana]